MQAVLKGLARTGNFSGRAEPAEFWWLACGLVLIVGTGYWLGLLNPSAGTSTWVVLAVATLSVASAAARRVHDAGVSALQLLYVPVPFVMIWGFFFLLFPLSFHAGPLGVILTLVVGVPLFLVKLASICVEALAGIGALLLPSDPSPNQHGRPMAMGRETVIVARPPETP